MQPQTAAVDAHIAALPAGLVPLVQATRAAILAAHPLIGEHVKWNSPAFFYLGEMEDFDAKEYKRDIAVMHLRKGHVLLVLPTGAAVAAGHPVLEGTYADGRRLVTIRDMAELVAKTSALQAALQAWVAQAH